MPVLRSGNPYNDMYPPSGTPFPDPLIVDDATESIELDTFALLTSSLPPTNFFQPLFPDTPAPNAQASYAPTSADPTFEVIHQCFTRLFGSELASYLCHCGFSTLHVLSTTYVGHVTLTKTLRPIPFGHRVLIISFFHWAYARPSLSILELRALTSDSLTHWVLTNPLPHVPIVSVAPPTPFPQLNVFNDVPLSTDPTCDVIHQCFSRLLGSELASYLCRCGYRTLPILSSAYLDQETLHKDLRPIPFRLQSIVRHFFRWASTRDSLSILDLRSLSVHRLTHWANLTALTPVPSVPTSSSTMTQPPDPVSRPVPIQLLPPDPFSDFNEYIKRNITATWKPTTLFSRFAPPVPWHHSLFIHSSAVHKFHSMLVALQWCKTLGRIDIETSFFSFPVCPADTKALCPISFFNHVKRGEMMKDGETQEKIYMDELDVQQREGQVQRRALLWGVTSGGES